MQALLPPRDARRMREVEVRAPAVPELVEARRAFAVADEAASRAHFGERRMIVEQARLQVGDELDTRPPGTRRVASRGVGNLSRFQVKT